MKNKLLYSALAVTTLFPAVSFAALTGLKSLLVDFGGIISSSISILFALAIVYFFWGVGQFILKDAANEKTRAEGQKKMLWGIIAIFVMASLFGILVAFGNLIGVPVNQKGGVWPINLAPLQTNP